MLVQTIAVAGIHAGGATSSLPTQSARTDSGFLPAGRLDLAGSVPFSTYGYHDRATLRDGVHRFPVVGLSDGYICIVLNSRADRRTWIEQPTSGGSWDAGVVRFDSLPGHPRWLDPFSLTGRTVLGLYEDGDGLRQHLVSKADVRDPLRAVEQRGLFIRVVAAVDHGEWIEERPLGWIRVRDTTRRLLVWPISVDTPPTAHRSLVRCT